MARGLHLHHEHKDQIQRPRIHQALASPTPRRRSARPPLPPMRPPYRPHATLDAPALIHSRPPRRNSKRRKPPRRARTSTSTLQLTPRQTPPAHTNQKAENITRLVNCVTQGGGHTPPIPHLSPYGHSRFSPRGRPARNCTFGGASDGSQVETARHLRRFHAP